MGWCRYTTDEGASISVDTFGASAPDKVVFEKYGFTVDNVVAKAKALLG
jgi:transketolase